MDCSTSASAGQVWLWFDGTNFTVLGKAADRSVPREGVPSIFRDRDDDTRGPPAGMREWSGMTELPWSPLDEEDGLPGKEVPPSPKARDGAYWIGTTKGSVVIGPCGRRRRRRKWSSRRTRSAAAANDPAIPTGQWVGFHCQRGWTSGRNPAPPLSESHCTRQG